MFGGGAAGRPIGMFSNLGKAYGAVGAWYTLQQYTLSSLSMMYKLGLDGFTRWKSEGLSQADVNNARKAFTQMFATQFAAAGAMGMPLMGITGALMEQLFPNLQLKASVREGLSSLAGDDDEMGQFISDATLHGVGPTALGLGSLDLSGRFSLGQMFGLDPDRGFQPENVFGAPGSVLGNFARAVGAASTGETAEAVRRASPMVFKNAINLYKNSWDVRDAQGKLIYTPTQFEKIASVAGFRPKRLAMFREEQQLSRRASDIEARNLRDFHDQVATEILNGNAQTARALLLERNRVDPLYDPMAGLRASVELAQARVTPMVPSAEGSKGSIYQREAIARQFPSTAQPKQTELYLRRKEMERMVGLPGSGTVSRHELTREQMVDQLVQMHPSWTPQHARALLERAMARKGVGIPISLR